MIDKLKNRLASEQGFTLIELLVVIIILGILVAIAVPAYLSFTSKAHDAAVKSNVRSAVPAAEGYYQSQTPNSYAGISNANLVLQAPGIPATVLAAANTAGDGYCIQDTESGFTYSYTGGNNGTAAVTSGACGSGYGTPS